MAPDYIFYRDPMWLNCTVMDLDYNQIYSIKWFKDNDEMYRFITADESPATFYDTSGIVIDVSFLLFLTLLLPLSFFYYYFLPLFILSNHFYPTLSHYFNPSCIGIRLKADLNVTFFIFIFLLSLFFKHWQPKFFFFCK